MIIDSNNGLYKLLVILFLLPIWLNFINDVRIYIYIYIYSQIRRLRLHFIYWSCSFRPCLANNIKFSHIPSYYSFYFFEEKKSNHSLFISHHLLFITIQIKKITTKQNFSLSNTTFSFSHINHYFLLFF
jgi:hypothetical protein